MEFDSIFNSSQTVQDRSSSQHLVKDGHITLGHIGSLKNVFPFKRQVH
jgi:hypothetical protein